MFREPLTYLVVITAIILYHSSDCYSQQQVGEEGQRVEQALDEIVVESTGLGQTLSDQAQSVTVLSGTDLDRKVSSSLGETLAAEPGITSSSFGPGAGRPVIRGLGGDRIRVLENGVGSQDLSAVSPDHAVSIESSLVDKIEVVRGPAALLYGTSAIGGIVNIFDQRIPEELPTAPFEGTAEVRGESVSNSRTGLFSITVPTDNFAFHVDALGSKAGDIDIPGYARTAQARESSQLTYPEPRGTLPFSDTQTDIFTVGGSYILERGFLGAAVNDYKTIYGVPNGEEDVSVNAHRRRLDLRGGVKDSGEFVESATIRAGLVNYDHTEFDGDEAGTKFMSDSFDARIDMQHAKISDLRGTWGGQVQESNFQALGDEAFQPPSTTNTYSLFALEEHAVSERLSVQAGARYDWSEVRTKGFDSESLLDNYDKDRHLFGQSAGIVWDVWRDCSLTLSTAHTERAPTAQELFANGRHVATGVFEVGDADLLVERSLGSDISLRRSEGMIRGFVGGFYNRFSNYINASPTGQVRGDLPEFQFENIPADFWGFESQLEMYLEDAHHREVSLDIQPDYVWARNRETHEYLPRIPPLRIKVGANYVVPQYGTARLEVQHVFRQDKTVEFETSTDAYTMLNAYASRELEYDGRPVELFVRGSNLLGEKARNHVSFINNVAPLPGASAMVGIRIRF